MVHRKSDGPAVRAALGLVLVALALVVGSPAIASSPLPAAAPAATEASSIERDPQAVMIDVSTRLFAALDSNRVALRRNPEAVYPIVDQIVFPHFDVEYATQLVLAQHWRTATPEQRQQFIDAFYHALLRTYGSALADATADRLKVLPFRGDPSAPQVTVRTEVTRSSGGAVPVDYRLHRTPDGWKAFDVVIEGISYVRNYRADLDAEISARGLDAVIHRIETQGLAPARGGSGGH
jgi:phospholipid transport system substrate-binding protein